ncbi:hypothetical protein D3C72_1312840 [compost metagenome]
MGDQRNDHDGGQQVADGPWQTEQQLECLRHDGRLEREEDKGETGVDQRGDGGAEVAEPGAPCQQVHVYPMAGGVVGDRQAGQEDDKADHPDGPHRVGKAIAERDGSPDGFQRKERDCTKSGISDPKCAPFPERPWCKPQRVVLQGFVGDPAVVVAPDLADALDGLGNARHGGGCMVALAKGRALPMQEMCRAPRTARLR